MNHAFWVWSDVKRKYWTGNLSKIIINDARGSRSQTAGIMVTIEETDSRRRHFHEL